MLIFYVYGCYMLLWVMLGPFSEPHPSSAQECLQHGTHRLQGRVPWHDRQYMIYVYTHVYHICKISKSIGNMFSPYIYIYTYIYIYIYICIYMLLYNILYIILYIIKIYYIYMHINIHAYAYAFVYRYMYLYMHMYVHVFLHMCMCVCVCVCVCLSV